MSRRLAERMLTRPSGSAARSTTCSSSAASRPRRRPSREPVPVHLFIAEAVERMRPGGRAAGIAIEVDEPPRRSTVVGDRRQLVSAIYNLLENAVKYSDDGLGGRGAGRHRRPAGRHRRCRPRHRHPRRDLERIFERFYRVDRARSRETGGTGLGWRSCATWPATTTARSASSRTKGRARRSPCASRRRPGPVAVTSEAG